MNEIKQMVKKKVLSMIDLIPWGRDIFLLLTKGRTNISYRGVFDSFEKACIAVPGNKSKDYDLINANKAINSEKEKKTLDDWFHVTDYPLLFWLSKLLGVQSTVLELGGSVGHFFYSMQKYSPIPENVKWTIAELPAAVKLGKEIARDRAERRIHFVNSSAINFTEAVDIFMTAGTLQYMDSNLTDILRELSALPRNILVHNLPVHHQRSFVTLQNLGLCQVPYRIYSKPELINSMDCLGYKLMGEWLNERQIEIPFHRSLSVVGYMGFYFCKKD